MAPLTRNRASPGYRPNALMARYYSQRAGSGLIITEGTPIAPMAHGYLDTPGLHDDAQVQGWREVTAAVHAAGGRIVAQIWHVGRISHTSLLPGGVAPISSSAIPARSKTFTSKGFENVSAPRAMSIDEVREAVTQFRDAAVRAMEAGFDGVEVHGANGYLVEQFLRDSLNTRSDIYGGGMAQRVRFAVEVMEAIAAAIGAGRTGLRISPVTPANDAAPDSDAQALFEHLLIRLAPLKLAFIEVVEGSTGAARDHLPFDYQALHRIYKAANPQGGWILNNGYTRALALQAVAEGRADAISFGRPSLANPDLARRLLLDAPLNAADRATFYGGGEAGYMDYPAMDHPGAGNAAAAG
jgi:N-ethylmaleimide reductase